MKQPPWLKNSIFYQVYPQSFYDSNGDGIGDIPGLIEKLDYIRGLGCNAIWLNPCFLSPFNDAGYDISDYYKVAPRYGTNADLKRLFRQAHQRALRVLLDLVPAHTSLEHPWFKASCRPDKNEYTDRYLWTDSTWVWNEPAFTFIRGFSDREGCFLPSFFWSQPALNFGFAQPDPAKPWQYPTDHPTCQAARQAMMEVMQFWLKAGCDGFRIDMASSLIKNDPGWKETSKLWRGVRQWFNHNWPQAVLVAEWSSPTAAITAGFHMDFMLHMNDIAYNYLFRQEASRNLFWNPKGHSFFDRQGLGDITAFLDSYAKHLAATKHKGYISIPTGCHDLSRIRLGRTPKEVEIIFAFILTMPGVPFIYYGDEIGMRQITGLTSKEGGHCRTGARTPMQWTRGKNAGFSTAPAKQLYLPIDSRKDAPCVDKQQQNSRSLLNTVKNLISLRKASEALGSDGVFEPLYAKKRKYPFVYLRRHNKEVYLVALNPSGTPQTADFTLPFLPDTLQQVLGTALTPSRRGRRCHVDMPPISWSIFRVTR